MKYNMGRRQNRLLWIIVVLFSISPTGGINQAMARDRNPQREEQRDQAWQRDRNGYHFRYGNSQDQRGFKPEGVRFWINTVK